MMWILGLLWLAVVGRIVLDDSIRFELWLGRTIRRITRSSSGVRR